ncbi:LOW QUALITY PROTEIN: DUF4308 domain-containing protein [Cephalotus follicularis]|uniref:DUF4308 domain-containing protein n=1 Tax=Cephalotus follicularis TaxID=3775 RepID=A0A1Q3CJT6_CEPFO|nr:LOW QUALITY PROTEIN: DUF4308 domain-containing protein [Cephalotus follicularis]
MASAYSSNLSLSSSYNFVDAKVPRQSAAASPQCVTLPSLPPPPLQSQNRPWRNIAYCRKIARNVMAMATGEAPAEVGATELPEIVKTIQETVRTSNSCNHFSCCFEVLGASENELVLGFIQWDKVEDKYALCSLAFAGVVALWGSTGMISAIDRLPLVPGVLELVGIGYTGWFAYKNLVFKPDREALLQKIKDSYKDIIGSS